MSDTPTIRLNKVLRELNISLDRAVDHLKTKGVEIEARPTTKISREVYQVLLDEFQTDMSKKVASQEVGEEQRKEKEALRLKIEQEQEEKRIAREKKSEEIIKAKAEISKPKAVGKIDLEEGGKSKPKKEVEAVEKTNSDSKADLQSDSKPDSKPDSKSDSKPQEVTPQKTEESVNQKTDETVEQATPKKAEESKSDTTSETGENESIKTKYQKLSGIKLTGAKIDLTQFEKKKKQEDSSKTKNQDRDNKKRKRKRIVSDNNQGRDQKNQNRRGGKNRPKQGVQKVEPTEEEVQKQVRETLEKLQGKSSKGKGAKYRREKRDLHQFIGVK